MADFTQDVLDALAPMLYAEATTGDALTDYLSGLSLPFELVEEWVSDTDTDIGWSLLLDPDRCPVEALPWLAQIVGMTLDTSLSETDQRQQIHMANNWRRGTPAAIRNAPLPWLTGSKSVVLRERYDGSSNDAPWDIEVITLADETPGEDRATTNLCQNSGAETNTTGWSVISGSTLTRDLINVLDGIASFEVVTTATPNTGAIYGSTSPTLPVIVGSSYAFQVLVQFPIGTSGRILIDWRTSGNAFISNVLTNFAGTGAPQLITVVGVAPATAAKAFIDIIQTTSTATAFNFDKVQFEQNTVPTPVVPTDGATASRDAGFGPVGAAIRSQKPTGIRLLYVNAVGQDLQQVKDNYATLQDVKDAYATLNGLRTNTLGA